ncbi:longitudinals lacking protein-like [Tetranychus urticae]|uniref:BTB domain-containing protein n=1 Tax=Tetranychus urticae TaxID=32264 RepID=T1JY72_TETUR|nr:longitudinals lacking protein-like [Tetranychus urticae]
MAAAPEASASIPPMSAQAFCLRRNNHSTDMSEHFERMFKEESMVDVTLSCGDGSIRAHKMVLSACSSYFKNIFSKFINPYQYPVVIMKDMPFADLRAIVEFIYRGEVFVPQEQLASVLKSAESLKVKGLSEVNATKSLVPHEGGETAAQTSRGGRKGRKSNTTSSDGSPSNFAFQGVQRFQCHICHQGFTAKRNLQRHMQIHSYYRNKFECDLCGKKFSWKHGLNSHKEKTHNINV